MVGNGDSPSDGEILEVHYAGWYDTFVVVMSSDDDNDDGSNIPNNAGIHFFQQAVHASQNNNHSGVSIRYVPHPFERDGRRRNSKQ